MRRAWRWFQDLSWPAPIRVVAMLVALVVLVAVLLVLFEWAGDLLDTGGTVGL